MICYKDRSYCSFSDECANKSCDRNFTDADAVALARWWGGKAAPVAYMPMKTANCGYRPAAKDEK